jgi:hypothetical protein
LGRAARAPTRRGLVPPSHGTTKRRNCCFRVPSESKCFYVFLNQKDLFWRIWLKIEQRSPQGAVDELIHLGLWTSPFFKVWRSDFSRPSKPQVPRPFVKRAQEAWKWTQTHSRCLGWFAAEVGHNGHSLPDPSVIHLFVAARLTCDYGKR